MNNWKKSIADLQQIVIRTKLFLLSGLLLYTAHFTIQIL
jgi:hypothetical protein